jgi:hypothetical protein
MEAWSGDSIAGSSNRVHIKQERSMSKFVKIAVILAVAAVAIAAKQLTQVDMSAEAQLVTSAASVAPMEIMHKAGQLPETPVDSYF